IHTVAAGGGSLLHFEAGRFRVGPDSAGANPGPARYRRGGPLTVTDAHVMPGKLPPHLFPHIFGPGQDQPPGPDIVLAKFAAGALTGTDAHVRLGQLQPHLLPHIFGPAQDQPLDADIVRAKFAALAEKIGDGRSPEAVAEGFITIAVENMANAIKKISVQRGYDVTQYLLNSFGGAGGQHACLVADSLGIE